MLAGRLLLAVLLALPAGAAVAATQLKFAAGPERSAQFQIARDIARFVARAADIDLEVVATLGAVDNLQRLRDDAAMRFALLPSDTMHAYLDAAARGNADANLFVAPLRVVAPLYEEQIYFIARSDSVLNAVHEIKDARINVGPLGGGTALSVTTFFRLMFGAAIADDKLSFLPHEDALVKLITDKTVDVVAVLAEQPAKLLADMRPEARRYVKLLRFDAAHPSAAAIQGVYGASSLRPASYPNLLSDDLPAVSLRTYLVAYSVRSGDLDAQLARFTRTLCQNLPRLKAEGHPQWHEVEIAHAALGPGWFYAKAAARELRRCTDASTAPQQGDVCSQQDRVLGLCP